MASNVNMSGWKNKVELSKQALAKAISAAVDYGMDKVYKETDKNLKGPHYLPPARIPEIGTMPVPVVFGQLSKSLRFERPSATSGVIYSDKRACTYNKIIHDGGHGRSPRRFLGDAVSKWRLAIYTEWKNQILTAIRKEGQK